MTDIQIGLLSIVGILVLIYVGMHVAIALTLLSFSGVGLIKGNWAIASKLLALAASDSISGYIFNPLIKIGRSGSLLAWKPYMKR